MDTREQIFAPGVSTHGDAWTPGWQPDDGWGITWLRVTTPDGHSHKGGYGSPSISPDSEVSVYTSSRDGVPNGAILRVGEGATALHVTTSDGLTQPVNLVPHPAHEGALVAAVVYPH